jgi:cation:H+ antiporter
MLGVSLAIFFFLFFLIWVGSGLVVSSVDKIRRKLKMSSFIISFFVLGVFTTIPELAIGINAVSKGEPEIFVGNLLGATAVIFLLVIPLLAIFGNGIKLRHKLSRFSLIVVLMVCLLPAFFILDKKISFSEGIVMIVSYIFAGYFMQDKYKLFGHKKHHSSILRRYSMLDMFKLLIGVVLIFIASHFIVNRLVEISEYLSLSPFFISFAVLSIGTNLPEISLAVRSILSKRKELAFGSYLGSAATNTFALGFLSSINGGETVTLKNFVLNFIFIGLGIGAFYFFTRSKNDISRREGFFLLALYFVFGFFELIIIQG